MKLIFMKLNIWYIEEYDENKLYLLEQELIDEISASSKYLNWMILFGNFE